MKTGLVAGKLIRELWREPQLLVVYLLFPAVMIGLYYLAFGRPASAMANFLQIQVLDLDGGPAAARLGAALRDLEYEGSPVFSVEQVPSRAAAQPFLDERKIALLVEIPQGFSAAIAAGTPWQTSVSLVGDPLTDGYALATSFLTPLAQSMTGGEAAPAVPALNYAFIEGTGTMNDFQFGVPGLIVFGVLFGVIGAALILVRETSSGTIQRLRLAQVHGGTILGGAVLALGGLSLVQMLLSAGVAAAFGFPIWGAGSILLTVGICLALSTAATGLGIATAALARSEGDAVNLATLVMMPLVFLSGAIFPMPAVPLFQLAGQTVSLYDLMPSTHAAEALRRVLVYGDGPGAMLYSLLGLVISSLICLAGGAWLYQKRRLN